jgi:hypothetical protein
MKEIIIIILVFCSLVAKSQNDTLYLKKNCIQFQGVKYNFLDDNLNKIGDWIEYGESQNLMLLECASGYDSESDVDCHWYTNVTIKYRPLEIGEKDGMRIVKSEKLDTSFMDKRYHIEAEEIQSKIPPDSYYFKARGKYDFNKKSGRWTYFYQTGKILKEIIYKNDLPDKSFKIFREDGTLMISVDKIDNTHWEIAKYSELEKLKETQTGKIDEFKILY